MSPYPKKLKLNLTRTLFAISCSICCMLLVGLIACDSMKSPTSSSQSEAPTPSSTGVTNPTSPSNPTAVPTAPKGCDVIQVKRVDIEVETDCRNGARFYVPATVTLGTGYFNVWLPAVNDGEKLGPFAYNEWTDWQPMVVGTYAWALAAETKTVDGTVYQCDRHKGEFTVPRCPVVPECPSNAHFDIVVIQASQPTVVPDNCPDLEGSTFSVATNLPVVDLNLPSGCVTLTPTSGACQFPVEEETYQVAISGLGRTLDGMLCGSDFETITIEGCTCILPDPPECAHGLPTPHPVVCSWVCPPCEITCGEGYHLHPEECACYCSPVGKPKCQEQIWNELTCKWEGDCPCEYIITAPKIGKVFCHDLVKPRNECAYFAPGTTAIAKIDGSSPFATMDADVVIQKKGGGRVCGKKKRYIVYEGVAAGDPLKGGWSHTTYCNCQESE